MLKIIITFLLVTIATIVNASPDLTYKCSNSEYELEIKVVTKLRTKQVFWVISSQGQEIEETKGSGTWVKEKESLDAFSAFDEYTAISYKNSSAVFVYDTDKVLAFDCKP